ncbi:MAG: aminoglycoside phosphotransferase family protein [Paracoccaceae bacterium]
MTSRETAILAFLDNAGWADSEMAPLAGDASARRYLRLRGSKGAAVLMDAPPDQGEDTQPFITMTRWLRANALSAPEILADDPTMGFLLLEDLGDALYAQHLTKIPTAETDLYSMAVRLLVSLADLGPAPHLANYAGSELWREAALFTEWWLPAATADGSHWAKDDYRTLVEATFPPVAGAKEVTVLRDFHAENLLWLPERGGTAAVGLLDYQDALAGHAAYDLMSLLEDARRDTSRELQEAMIRLYLSERPDLNQNTFRRDYAILAAQRNLKIMGIFARLALRDGKPRYLDLIPRVWGHLQHDLAHPELASLRAWITAYAPPPTPDVLSQVAARVRSGP